MSPATRDHALFKARVHLLPLRMASAMLQYPRMLRKTKMEETFLRNTDMSVSPHLRVLELSWIVKKQARFKGANWVPQEFLRDECTDMKWRINHLTVGRNLSLTKIISSSKLILHLRVSLTVEAPLTVQNPTRSFYWISFSPKASNTRDSSCSRF